MNEANKPPSQEQTLSAAHKPLECDATGRLLPPAQDTLLNPNTALAESFEPLTKLFAVERELARADSMDALCLRAIVLGCEQLEFDRLGLWFFDVQPGRLRGMFGTDEHGKLRDERDKRVEGHPQLYAPAFMDKHEPVLLLDNVPLKNDRGDTVGIGQHAISLLWDGDEALGILSTDNLLTGQPITHRQQETLYVYATLIGFLCSRLRADAKTHQREAMYRQAIATANGVVYQLDFRLNAYVHLDEGIERLIGYNVAEVTPSLWPRIGRLFKTHGELAGFTSPEATRLFRAGAVHVWHADYVCRTKQGDLCWISDSSIPLRDEAGVVSGCLGILQDITERVLSERALRESEERFRAAVSGSSDGLYDADLTTGDVYYSPRFLELLGYADYPEEFTTRLEEFERHLHPEDKARAEKQLAESLTTGVPLRSEYRLQTRSGEYRWFQIRSDVLRDENSAPIRMAGFLTDISESKRLQEQLLQAQKLESIGRLAGGVAHDFNNLLTAIMGYADLAKINVQDRNRQATYLDNIIHAGERAADLTRQLLAFARKQIIAPIILDINALLLDTERILQRLIGEEIELVTQPGKEPGLIRADPGQIQQVLINLVVNARDAMPDGGKLTLETANVTLDAKSAQRQLDIIPGPYVMLAVSDTGIGMEESVKQHIFEPFFTTKDQNKGTGLGLATCHGIVKQNGGHIWVHSAPGRGSTFKIFLPQIIEGLPASTPIEQPMPLLGKETILLVEDDTLLCNFARETLQEKGYNVLAASRGEEGLRLAEEYVGEIHLLITDVIMPQMRGTALASQLKQIRPRAKVLYISGYTDEVIVQQGVLEEGVAFLQKPFSARSLAIKVRETLDGSIYLNEEANHA